MGRKKISVKQQKDGKLMLFVQNHRKRKAKKIVGAMITTKETLKADLVGLLGSVRDDEAGLSNGPTSVGGE